MERPPVWQMVREAVERLNGKASRKDIKEYINNIWQEVKDHTIICQIQLLTVNHKSRIHYFENQKPRLTNCNSPFDLFYETPEKQIIKYEIIHHGIWEIYNNENNKLAVREYSDNTEKLSISYEDTILVEGTQTQSLANRYERNSTAREICLKVHGYSCVICNMNFEAIYGILGRNFIHVHHLKRLSDIKKSYQINPIDDLRPVCPNCHAMLHRRNPPLEIDELKALIE